MTKAVKPSALLICVDGCEFVSHPQRNAQVVAIPGDSFFLINDMLICCAGWRNWKPERKMPCSKLGLLGFCDSKCCLGVRDPCVSYGNR